MYPCPCCGYMIFGEPPGSNDICPICFWEDDLSQLRFPTITGANHVSLIEGQKNYAVTRACELRMLPHVRSPTLSDLRDPEWRLIDESSDSIEEPASGIDYGTSYPEDSTRLYYWRQNHWRR